jgi:hypothetical protein
MSDQAIRIVRTLAREVADDATLGRLVRVGLLEDDALGWLVRQAALARVTGIVGDPPLLRWGAEAEPAPATAAAPPLEEDAARHAPEEEDAETLDDWCRRVSEWLELQPDARWRGTAPELVVAVPGYPGATLRSLGTRLGRLTATGQRRCGIRVLAREWCGPKVATYTLTSR